MWRCFGCLALLAASASANVIGVDLGLDYMKVALVAPRRPLEIVTNTASKRKTEMAINFDRGERSFGGDALVLLSRKPEQTFTKLSALLGRNATHPAIEALSTSGLPPITYNETRGGLSLHLSDRGSKADYSPEELVAMVLTHAFDITQMFGYTVRDAVFAVPQFWTAHERRAMADAVELSGLSALSFLDENTAAALQYSIDRAHDEPHNVLFYNIGAGAAQATVVTFGPKMEKGKNVGQFTVRGKAWDTELGGHWFDLCLTDLLADQFNKKWGKGDIRNFPKAMAKLRVNASKVKQVLSANVEIPVTIQSLHDDVDFVTVVTRSQFEAVAEQLFSRVTGPVTDALKAANMTIADLHGVEVIGGGVRVPRVQEVLKTHLSPLDLGLHLNGDEAVALGAAFAGANASRAFHVRQVGMTDITPFAVEVSLKDLPLSASATAEPAKQNAFASMLGSFGKGKKQDKAELSAESDGAVSAGSNNAGDNNAAADANSNSSGSAEFSKRLQLFASGAATSAKKNFALTHDRDMTANISYVQGETNFLLPAGTQPLIASYNITGIEKFAAETVKDNLGLPKVTLRFGMDNFGVPVLTEAEATVTFDKEITYEETVEIEDDEPADTNSSSSSNATDKDADKDSTSSADAEEGDEAVIEAETTASAEPADSEDSAGHDASADADADAASPESEAAAAGDDAEADSKAKKGGKQKNSKKKAKSEPKKPAKQPAKKKRTEKVTKTKTVQQTRRRKLEIALFYDYCALRPMSAEEKAHSKAKLGVLTAADKARHAKAQAKNDLEAYILSVRNRLGEDAKETILEVTTSDQRQSIVELANQLEEWLYDDGWDEDASTYRSKHMSLSEAADAAFKRADEAATRPEEVKRARNFLDKLVESVDKWKITKPQITADERNDLLEKVAKVEQWLDEKEAQQAATDLHKDPVFLSTDIEPQLTTVKSLVARLAQKPAPPKPDKKKGGSKKKKGSKSKGDSAADSEADADGAGAAGEDDQTGDATPAEGDSDEGEEGADDTELEAEAADQDQDSPAEDADDSEEALRDEL